MNKSEGGPAFPGEMGAFNRGMTLRDYFAAHILSGMLADPNLKGKAEEWASRSYRLADAMLAERLKS